MLWIGSFVCYILGLTNPMLGLVAMLLICSTPFLAASRLRHYRDYGREGIISFARSYAYTVMIFFYAGVLLAIVIYLYFAFMDKGMFVGKLIEILQSPEGKQAIQAYGMEAQMDVDFALNMLTVNIISGFFLGIPIAAIMQRREKREERSEK